MQNQKYIWWKSPFQELQKLPNQVKMKEPNTVLNHICPITLCVRDLLTTFDMPSRPYPHVRIPHLVFAKAFYLTAIHLPASSRSQSSLCICKVGPSLSSHMRLLAFAKRKTRGLPHPSSWSQSKPAHYQQQIIQTWSATTRDTPEALRDLVLSCQLVRRHDTNSLEASNHTKHIQIMNQRLKFFFLTFKYSNFD